MELIDKKKKILESGIAHQNSIINDFKGRIKTLQDSEVVPNEDEVDLQQKSLNDEANNLTIELADQLKFANDELELLYKIVIEEPLHDEVAFGSVVETDKMKFFVSVSLENFDVDGEEYFGISTHAPIFEKMKGLKAGDGFELNGRSYQINGLY